MTAVLDPVVDTEHQWALDQARWLLGLHRRRPPSIPLADVVRAGRPPKVVLSYGLGVDSSAVAARLITEPDVRDFELDDLLVITAGTGQEWPRTLQLVSQHVLPLLARHHVRYIQVARRGPTEADGVDVTADSRNPDQLHLVGAWTLADEMFDAGTVPQTCGDRICSQHFKGFALDTVIAAVTQGQPFRHLIGFSAAEQARANRDRRYDTELRTAEYPLINWGFDRPKALAYLATVFDGAEFCKSACTYCPFALSTEDGRRATVEQFIAEPHAGLLALAMEFSATCLNPTQGLINSRRLLTLLRGSPGTEQVLASFDEYLASVPWALYEVRRTFSPRVDGRFNHARAVRILDAGSRPVMLAQLRARAAAAHVEISVGDARFTDDQHPRAWLRRRDPVELAGAAAVVDAEHFLTLAPATATSKTGPAFPKAWAAANQFHLAV